MTHSYSCTLTMCGLISEHPNTRATSEQDRTVKVRTVRAYKDACGGRNEQYSSALTAILRINTRFLSVIPWSEVSHHRDHQAVGEPGRSEFVCSGPSLPLRRSAPAKVGEEVDGLKSFGRHGNSAVLDNLSSS
jgi:hypothetical protein